VRREGIPNPIVNEWTNVPCEPGSPIADFCVIRKERKDGQADLLERTSAEVVLATDAIAQEELTIFEARNNSLHRVYTPMIVTTAELFVCDADYRKVNFDTGEVDNATVRAVPFIRFTKRLSAGKISRKSATLEDVSNQSERSVIVVQANSFLTFLQQWDLSNLPSELAGALFS
jgi:hypothetical protein